LGTQRTFNEYIKRVTPDEEQDKTKKGEKEEEKQEQKYIGNPRIKDRTSCATDLVTSTAHSLHVFRSNAPTDQ